MTIIGYVYDSDGRYDRKHYFDDTPENIANFIMYNWMNSVVITDMVDNFMVSSSAGGFLDRVASPELREKILEKIMPIQFGEIDAYEVVEVNYED